MHLEEKISTNTCDISYSEKNLTWSLHYYFRFIQRKKKYSRGHTSLIKRHFSTFKDTMKTMTLCFPQARRTTPCGTLFFIRQNGDHQPGLCSGVAWTREGTGVPDRLSSRVGGTYTGGGDSSSNADSKKAGGTNKSLLNTLTTNAESWLSQSLKPQIATLNFHKLFNLRGNKGNLRNSCLKTQNLGLSWMKLNREQGRADGHHLTSCSLSVLSVPLCYWPPTNCPWDCMIRGEQQLY